MNTKTIITVSLIWLLSLGGIYFYVESTRPQLSYVNVGELYNGFGLKTELEDQFEATRMQRKSTLDSMRLAVNFIYNRSEQDNTNGEILQQYNVKRRQLEATEQQIIESDAALQEQLNDQIFM